MGRALERHDAILRDAIESQQGEVFKTAGDAFFGAFPQAGQALEAALAAQRRLGEENWQEVGGCKVRMAIHCGPANFRGGDYFGPALNRCARLLNLGYGGQILLTRSMAEELAAAGSDIEFPQIGLNPLDDPDVDEPIHQVSTPDLEQDFPALRDPRALPGNLPQILGTLVGRERETGEVQDALANDRWVTLSGIGGVGKTRLALEVAAIVANARRGGDSARQIRRRIPGGLWLVELAPIASGDVIASTVATAMSIELPGVRPPLRELIERLRSQAVLLLLDNCEHLLDAVAQFGFVLMAECPRILVLATSQDLVGLPGERAIIVRELALPPDGVSTAAEALRYASVQLFVERARAADPAFRLSDREASAACQICRDLDGIALAIEMAAARAPMFGVAALARRLADRFRELARTEDGGPARHQTLRAAIDWSHDLLGKRERSVLRRVSVFAGSFSLDDAAAVAGGDELEEVDVINALAELVRRSLVVRDQRDGEPRYHLLQTVLAYAREQLEQAGETAASEQAMLHRMRSVMQRSYGSALTMPDALIRESHQADLPNIRAAIDRGLEGSGDANGAADLAGCSAPLLMAMGLLPEARQRLEIAARQAPEIEPGVAARIWLGLGLAIGFSDPARACEMLDRAEPHYRLAGGPELAQLLIMKGRLSQVVAGREAESRTLIAEARPLIEQGGWDRLAGHLYRGLGNQCMADGKPGEGVEMMRRAESSFAAAGAEGAASTVRTSLGYLLWAAGDLDGAIAQCREVLLELREGRFVDDAVLGFVLGNLGGMLTEGGDRGEASATFAEAAPLLRDPWQLWVIFDHIALLHAKAGDLAGAARALGFADRCYRDHAAARQPNEARARESLRQLLGQGLTDDAIAAYQAQGAELSSDQAVAMARDIAISEMPG